MSERRKALVVACGAVALCIVASELVLRLFLPQKTFDRMLADSPAMYRKSDLLAYELLPGYRGRLKRDEFDTTITINSHGFRGREIGLDKRGRLRVLVVGDSFTLGWGIEDDEAYPAQLERILAQEHRRTDIEVINAGFAAGYSPDTYYLFLKERGLKLRPDLILIGFFIGNDIDHRGAFEHVWVKTDENGLPLQIKNVEGEVEDGRWMRKHKQLVYRLPVLRDSHLFHLLVAAGKGTKRLWAGEAAVGEEAINPFTYKPVYAERTEAMVRKTKVLFRAMARLTAEAQVPLAVIMIPAREQVYADRLPPGLQDGQDWEKPQRIFAEFFRQEGIPYLDLLPSLRAQAAKSEFYFRSDMHWNARGHEVGARIISAYLVEHGFLKGP